MRFEMISLGLDWRTKKWVPHKSEIECQEFKEDEKGYEFISRNKPGCEYSCRSLGKQIVVSLKRTDTLFQEVIK